MNAAANPPPARVRDRRIFGLVHASGRYDRPLPDVAAALPRLQGIASVVVHTEQAGRPAARDRLFVRAGWSFWHAAGPGAGEVVIQWSDQVDLAGEPRSQRLTSLRYWRKGGARTPYFTAAVVPLAVDASLPLVVVIGAHLPTRNTALRRRVWAAAMRGLVRTVRTVRRRYPGALVVVSADFNVDHRDGRGGHPLVARYLGPLGLADGWEGVTPAAGTHGARVIDGVWTDLAVQSCRVVVGDFPSDHRPLRAVLTFPGD